MIVELLLLLPLLAGAACYALKDTRLIATLSAAASALVFGLCGWLAYTVFTGSVISEGLWYVDALGAYMLALVSFIALAAALYSIGYIGEEHRRGEIGLPRVRQYYLFFHVFVFTMLLVCVSDNLGIMWIAIEATTLASAFLVGFYNRDTSVEAAWKYIIICSVGITLALLGTILLYASSIGPAGEAPWGLNWSTLAAHAASLDPALVKIAFILVLIGYGTKAGFAPMHTWLPDAHSEAPSPVSGLLSAVLLNCAMYGILRYHIIATGALGPGFSSTLLLLFGLLSMATAAAFIIVQKDYKRLLAYSSIEHMGIIALGFGIGGIGIFGALLHMLNHALTKSLLFFGAGNVLQKFHTKNIAEVRGMATLMPATAALFVAGALAITGSPPFGIFVSEILILKAGLATGNYAVSIVYLALLAAIFAGFMYHVGRMAFGQPAPGRVKGEQGRLGLAVMAFLLLLTLGLGLYIPTGLSDIFTRITTIFGGIA